ncbi:MAG: patatin-like phospholipase family protein [Flavobacterium sp.]|uniref:Patatin-like phospholipase family protein n=1 Tax=Flavobacterium celericrescens TaxID=2709780 RepID=A0ABX0I8E9_9FLAO|nr:patatin-like phospholipase family protein [Flavobacterium celericrescens]NHM03259.1 patatin-like phospholipase family protein [Flavobacterium celericrescens]
MDLASKSIGLALSGGGSKGIAHAGVLKFLSEQEITPSCIAGSSAGAIVGTMYAYGKKPEEILDFFKSIYFFHWKHFTFKKAGIVDSESFKKYFDEVFGATTLGELNIPMYVTATDMVKGKLKIFNPDTKVVDAVLASTAVPGMISPYIIKEKLYSDGGILNHFPADLLQGKCDSIIGVYVSPIQNLEATQLRSIKSVTYRALELLTANSNLQKFNHCDLIIEPKELTNFSTFETNKNKMDLIFEIGYNEAKKAFENLSL